MYIVSAFTSMNIVYKNCRFYVYSICSYLSNHLVDLFPFEEVSARDAVERGGAHGVVAVADVPRQLLQSGRARRHHRRPVRL